MLVDFFKEIEGLNYVVQRNWDNLPQSYVVGDHDDLDLFSSDEDRGKIEELVKKYGIKCDVRSPSEKYYPDKINEGLLKDRVKKDCFYIPSPLFAFLALYYHDNFHKESVYQDKLKKLFKVWVE